MHIQQKIVPCLWFDEQAEEAAAFYTGIFPDSRITRISRYGEAVQAALSMVDGTRTAQEIRETMVQRFPELFPDAPRAARLVSNVISALCE